MKSHLTNKSFTSLIASMSDNEDVKFAAITGDLQIICDHSHKKFWLTRCPDHIWDDVLSETETLTGYTPLIEDIDDEMAYGF